LPPTAAAGRAPGRPSGWRSAGRWRCGAQRVSARATCAATPCATSWARRAVPHATATHLLAKRLTSSSFATYDSTRWKKLMTRELRGAQAAAANANPRHRKGRRSGDGAAPARRQPRKRARSTQQLHAAQIPMRWERPRLRRAKKFRTYGRARARVAPPAQKYLHASDAPGWTPEARAGH
jgi:hypothetical protein